MDPTGCVVAAVPTIVVIAWIILAILTAWALYECFSCGYWMARCVGKVWQVRDDASEEETYSLRLVNDALASEDCKKMLKECPEAVWGFFLPGL